MLTIGADPEVFLKRGNEYISAVGKIGGTKTKPKKISKGFNIHEDNVAVEYNFPPAEEASEFVAHNQFCLDAVKMVADLHKCEVAIESDAFFSDEELSSPQAREFGCNPDYNAWNLDINPTPNAQQTNLRTAGGHIHIGYAGMDMRQKFQLIRALDIFLGIPLAMLEPNSRRTELYGNLGACRPKKYGVEWRVPSNIWVRDVHFQFDIFEAVCQIVHHAEDYTDLAERIREDVESIPRGTIGRLDNLDIFNLIKINLPCHSEAIYKGVLEKV